MQRLVTDSFRAVQDKIDPRNLSGQFEVFGYDFMIDADFKVWLIECNTNPSLEICCPLLARLIPEVLDNSFRLAVDPYFYPAEDCRKKVDLMPRIKYTLIFDSSIDKAANNDKQTDFEISDDEEQPLIIAD